MARFTQFLKAGDVITLTADNRASGRIWFLKSGEQDAGGPVVSPGDTLTMGPYVGNCTFAVDLKDGTVSVAPVDPNTQIPVPTTPVPEYVAPEAVTDIELVTTEDAIDIDTALPLLNELKGKYNALLTALQPE